MTRVLMLCERFPPDLGGLARSGARIAGSLAACGAEVEVLAWTRTIPPGLVRSGPGEDATPAATGVTLHRMGLYANSDFSMQHTLNLIEFLHGERPYDLIWGHYLFPPGFVAVTAGAMFDIPSLVAARGNDLDRAMFPPGDFARLRWTLERAGRRVAVSKDLGRKMDVLLGQRDSSLVLPNAVDGEIFKPGLSTDKLAERRALGIADDELVLGFSGELRHKKGLPFLLGALQQVRAARPACLLVIGELRERAKSRLAALDLDDAETAERVLVTGRVDQQPEVARLLGLCDVFLHPSVWDGMPNAVLEAMACGVPVLASDAGGIPDVITHGESGLMIPKAKLNHLGAAILELFEQPEETRAAIGRGGRERVLDAFQPEHERAALAGVLEQITAS